MAPHYDVCLVSSPFRNIVRELRILLRPLDKLHHRLLTSVEAYYDDLDDELVLRLRFADCISTTDHKERLLHHLASPGLEIVVPEQLDPLPRAEFEKRLRDHYDISIQLFPTGGSVFQSILDAVEANIEDMQRSKTPPRQTDSVPASTRKASEISWTPRPIKVRAETIDALDAIIEELHDTH